MAGSARIRLPWELKDVCGEVEKILCGKNVQMLEGADMKRILVVYHSQEYGNTAKMAELVARGCQQVSGVEVEMINTNNSRVNMETAEQADGFAIGSPDYFSYVAGGVKQFFDDLYIAALAGKNVKGKPCVLFMTHGGGGKGIAGLESLARAMNLEIIAPSVTCQGAPGGDASQQGIELGKLLAERIS